MQWLRSASFSQQCHQLIHHVITSFSSWAAVVSRQLGLWSSSHSRGSYCSNQPSSSMPRTLHLHGDVSVIIAVLSGVHPRHGTKALCIRQTGKWCCSRGCSLADEQSRLADLRLSSVGRYLFILISPLLNLNSRDNNVRWSWGSVWLDSGCLAQRATISTSVKQTLSTTASRTASLLYSTYQVSCRVN